MPKRRTFLTLLLSAALCLPLFADYQPPAIGDFDSTNDYLLLGSDLTGNADGKQGIISFWYRLDGSDATNLIAIANNTTRFFVQRNSGNAILFIGSTSAPATVLNIFASNVVASTTWSHVVASWNLAVPVSHIYTDDVSNKTETTLIDGIIDYTGADWGIGALTSAGQKWDGALAEFYFTQEFLDLSVEENRRLFISRAGHPVDLGINGARPTGTAALVYMRTRANNAGINSGTGGDFAIQGAPLYSDGPFPFFPLTVPIPDRGMGSRIH